jgi:hypothetical protein
MKCLLRAHKIKHFKVATVFSPQLYRRYPPSNVTSPFSYPQSAAVGTVVTEGTRSAESSDLK